MQQQGIEIKEKDGVYHISGQINEFADFSPLTSAKEPLTVDFSGIRRINSIGVRNLLKFLNEWGDKKLLYRNCPVDFIDQLNMIPTLLGLQNQASVESFFVPWECDNCGHADDKLGKPSEFKHVLDGELEKQTCPDCGEKELTVLNDSYFSFLDPPG